MKKKTDIKISTPFKISIISGVLLILINVALVFFVLLPIYDISGDSTISTLEKTKKLDDAEETTNNVIGLSTVLIFVTLTSGGYGVYKEITTKDTNKKIDNSSKSSKKKTTKKKK